MKAQIICIGNELLIGDTINTNACWLGEFLTGLGFTINHVHTISDELNLIKKTIKNAMLESDVVITTGGLGPTHDDITKTAVAELFEVGYKRDENTLNHVKEIFKSRNIPFSKSNYQQADVPENAEVLFNKSGTAPGMWIEAGSYLVVLPGVPFEMKYLMKKKVAPKFRKVFGDLGFFYSRYIKTAGIGESTLSDEILGDLSDYYKNGVNLAFLPSGGGVTLRLTAGGITKSEAREFLESLANNIYQKAENYIYGEGKDYTISEAVGSLLKDQNLTISTSESCTGGLVADSITDVAGSSQYFEGGIIAYANQVKINKLGVSRKVLDNVGAVSKEVALQMAKGTAEQFNTDIGISTTGIAGPGGGTNEKPVGTVWMGFYQKNSHWFAIKALFTKDRLINKQRTMIVIMEIVRRVLKGIEEMPYQLKKQHP